MMQHTFRFALMPILLGATFVAHAQTFPNRPITVIVGFPPGGGADTVTRIVTERMAKALGQPIVVENKPGAGTTLASSHVAKSAPDGYTLLVTSSNIYGSDQLLYKSAQYDGARQFTPISRWSSAPMLLAVNKDFPPNTTQELIATVKRTPDKVAYSSSGVGVVTHLAALSFEKAADLKMQHIPFKGGSPSLQAVASGDVQLTFGTPPSVLPLAQAGRLKILAATTQQRSSLFPHIPSMGEAGLKDYDFTFWFGLFAPGNLPADVAQKLFDASTAALNDPQVKERLEKSGNASAPSKSLAEFREWAIADGKKYKELTEKSGATAE